MVLPRSRFAPRSACFPARTDGGEVEKDADDASSELRAAFLEFFRERGHAIVPSSPLVPGNDPTLLFTNAGMVQFKDVFLGKDERRYKRAVSSQRCVRAGGKHNDLENVGYTAATTPSSRCSATSASATTSSRKRSTSPGSSSPAPEASLHEKLWVTVFEDDDEAAELWLKKIGVVAKRFTRTRREGNFWAMGDTGPCGPCTEIFYDHGPDVRRPTGLAGRGRRPLRRDLEPRLHAVRTRRPTARSRRCRSPRSIPAWASSAWPPSCRACAPTTTPTCSRA